MRIAGRPELHSQGPWLARWTLQIGQIEPRYGVAAERVIRHAPHDADDLNADRVVDADRLADRVALPKEIRHAVVHHRDIAAVRVVARREFSPAKQLRSDRPEVTG